MDGRMDGWMGFAVSTNIDILVRRQGCVHMNKVRGNAQRGVHYQE